MKKTFKELGDLAVIMVLVIMVAVFINGTVTHAKTLAKDSVNGYTIKAVYYNGKTRICWNGKTYSTYNGKYKVRIINERDFTYEKKIRRKNDRIIYIEKVTGKCVKNNYWKDGESYYGYISYRCLGNKVHRGDKIITYFVWDPTSNSPDGCDDRFDVPLKYHRVRR